MRDLLILAVHLLVTVAKLLRPGGARAVAAESLLLKHQLQISNRSLRRSPNLTSLDRFLLGLTSLFVSPGCIAKLAAILKPATLFKFHNCGAQKLAAYECHLGPRASTRDGARPTPILQARAHPPATDVGILTSESPKSRSADQVHPDRGSCEACPSCNASPIL